MKRRRGPRMDMRLPTDGRRVHMSLQEIARHLNTSTQNVYQIHNRALRKLRVALIREGLGQ